ncbi:alpha-amylase family glycosyl hydrolase [Psychroflexus aestuariivivens]|uniref:alpha-amylase family glycosyl hydrolase n=1 Tax=Psychroflexus aestuariivivens TaxID=1795040 RepID=UPI000FD84989|nr:alpha-amylase family glycosyl hydrolase [Psychroflexus aestuariivivens]
MRKILLFICLITAAFGYSQVQTGNFTVSPTTFEEDEEITITVSGINTSTWGVSDVYLWTWYVSEDGNTQADSPTNGSWTNSDESQKMTDNGDGSFSYTFTPTNLYGATNIGQIGMLVKAKDGTGDKKTQDQIFPVGSFQVTLNSPDETTTVLNSGESLNISASASLDAEFELFQNGTSVDIQNGISEYLFSLTITEDSNFELIATEPNSGEVFEFTFNAILTPNPTIAPVPAGMENGINYDNSNPDEITLVLYAPNKSFVHVIGNFHNNNWVLDNQYLMNYDDTTNQFWLKIDNLDSMPSDDFLFQYVIETNIKVADPYSTLILNEINDQFIEESTFANIPEYPEAASEILSWVRLNQTDYQWQVTDFERPAQEDLVIYEMLIRDFDEDHSFNSVVNRLDYLENLGVNAIELMPVNEFDGNISWGYNPAFHMGLDKYYGTPEDFKNFVDECHARGIAVILDVVYNHATGQNPYYRMYNDCGGCYNGQATADNPIFNQNDPNTAFQFFNDINHESAATEDYVDKMNRFWIEEYNIDGYRFDFTKGFTNTSGDGGSYDASRISILNRMYDEIRAFDNDAYVILEHFAPNSEETELINHRFTTNNDEPGMMIWGNHNFDYSEATMGYNSNFSNVSYLNRGWSTPSNVSYMESHDEERLMYKNLEFGNSSGDYDITELNTALDRMELAGAFYFTIPGPKMIWQFGELGYDYSINYCEDGTISDDCRTAPKPIVWDYLNDSDRTDVYDSWAKMIQLKRDNSIFSTDNFTLETNNPAEKKIYLVDDNAAANEPEFVIILGNFGVTDITTQAFFQEAGTWYEAVSETDLNVQQTDMNITLAPGEFKIYFNNPPNLSQTEIKSLNYSVYPNPSQDYFSISNSVEKVEIYDLNGRQIKTFEGDFSANHRFEIEDLSSGIYILRYENYRQSETKKLIIE